MKTTVEIKKMGINGEGRGYINRKIVFVKGALLNEEVEIDAKQYNNKNYYFGDLIRVIKPSPMRVKTPCRANKECMGCNLLHYAYPAQLKQLRLFLPHLWHKRVRLKPHLLYRKTDSLFLLFWSQM